MSILYMVYDKSLADETFFAEFTCVFFTLLLNIYMGAAEFFKVLIDKLLLRIKVLLRTFLDSLDSQIDIFFEVVDGTTPL